MSLVTSTSGRYALLFSGGAAAGAFGPAASDLQQVYHFDQWTDYGLLYEVSSTTNSIGTNPVSSIVTVIAFDAGYTQDPADSGDNNLYAIGNKGTVVFGGAHQGVFNKNRWYVRTSSTTQSTSSAALQANLPKYYQGYRLDPDPTATTSIAWSIRCIIGNTSAVTTFTGIKQTIKNNWDRTRNQLPAFINRGTGQGGLGYIPQDTSVVVVSSAGVTVTVTSSISYIVNITAFGAKGGNAGGGYIGGQGGSTTWYGTFLTSNLTLTLYVAGSGTDGSDSYGNYFSAGAGGGATAVVFNSSIITIAAGGGGAAGFTANGGDGGPAVGEDGDTSLYGGYYNNYTVYGGKGGTQTAPGAGGTTTEPNAEVLYGYPGSGRNGGDGNAYATTWPFAGGWGYGTGGRGSYVSTLEWAYAGAGGGAGYYGGGGGAWDFGGGGGGGGSNYNLATTLSNVIPGTSATVRGGNNTSGAIILQVTQFISSQTIIAQNGVLVTSFVTRTTSVLATTNYGYTSAAARTVTFTA